MTMRALKTIVHVESRSRSWSVRNISATPASPVWVATRMCSMYLDLGAASCSHEASHQHLTLMITCMETMSIQTDLNLGGPLYRFLEIVGHGEGVSDSAIGP